MSWPLVSLEKIATVIRGVTFSSDDSIDTQESAYLPIIRAGNIQEKLYLHENLVWIPEKKIKNNQKIQLDDIVMCTSSGSPDLVGKCAISIEDWEGSFGAFCAGIRTDKSVASASYIYHFLCSPIFRQWTKNSSGANIKNIRVSELAEFKVPLPPLPEQKRIAAILDKADSIRRKRQQAIKLADEFLRSLFLDMFGDPVTNPKGWPIGSIRELASSVSYGTSEKAHETIGEFPVLRMMNITYEGKWDFTSLKYIDLDEKGKEKYLVFPGDLLFNRTNSKELVGKTAVYESTVPMAYAGYLVRLRTNERANPHYIAAYLNSAHGKMTLLNMCKSIVGMANINAQELQDINICIPPIELQNKFAAITSAIREHEKKMTDTHAEMDALFQSLSQKAFSGLL